MILSLDSAHWQPGFASVFLPCNSVPVTQDSAKGMIVTVFSVNFKFRPSCKFARISLRAGARAGITANVCHDDRHKFAGFQVRFKFKLKAGAVQVTVMDFKLVTVNLKLELRVT